MSAAQSNAHGLVDIILEDVGLSTGENYLEETSGDRSEASKAYKEIKNKLANSIDDLPEKEKIVLSLYYYDGLTLKEIGEVMGLTELKASQLHSQAAVELKSKFKTDLKGMSTAWKKPNARAEIVV
jgi:RNA polymerase sigma factor for flagellar operon FliA